MKTLVYDKGINRKLSEDQKQTFAKMLSEVEKNCYKTVSFKFDDTLIMLPFSEKCDLFLFMEDDFSFYNTGKKSFTELRMAAEEASLKKEEVYTRVTLEKIYKIFAKMSGISPEGKEKLMNRECELMEYFAFARECSKELFRKAKDTKKKTIIVSESIYPRKVVENILKNCGYGTYDMLVTVSDISGSTAESWYQKVIEKSKVRPDSLLHIGGKVEFDIELPIVKGSRALLLAPAGQLMEKSGRVLGYIRKKHLYDYDSQKYLMLHCILGLYVAYAFDYPQNKKPLSDFCKESCMIGFLAAGAREIMKEKAPVPPNEISALLVEAMRSDKGFLDGRDDLAVMLDRHFGQSLEKYGTEGCGDFLEFLAGFCGTADREFFKPYISASAMKKWAASVKEPEIVPFSGKSSRDNALYRLADKMFPPGTRVRNIVDGILSKGHKKRP